MKSYILLGKVMTDWKCYESTKQVNQAKCYPKTFYYYFVEIIAYHNVLPM